LHYRALILAAAAVVLIVGSYLSNGLSVDVLPNLTRPRVVVITECTGMAPEEVELQVTIPLENALNGAADVADVRSASDIGLSVIQVEFDWGQDIHRARQVVQERLVTTAEQLPGDVQPQMAPQASLLGQIMMIGLWSEDGTTSPVELRTQADWVVGQRLRSLRGVAQVITLGGGSRQIQVLLDPHKMHTYEVTLADVETALNASNLNVAGGFVSEGSQELLVRGLGKVATPDELSQVVVKASPRRSVLLSQVARIAEGTEAKRGDASVNGRPCVLLTIQKQPAADTRMLTGQILEAIEELRPSLPEDVVLRPTYLQREFIDLGISNVISSLLQGSVLVVVVLFVFLANLRATLITLTAIPLSLAVTVLMFHWFDMSINVMSLGGLAVGLGMLVDDPIVGVENVYRRSRQRLAGGATESLQNSIQFVLESTREVLPAIVISTVLVVVVIAPLFSLAGMEGRLFTPLAIAFLVSMVSSTLVAITVTPALCQVLLTPAALQKTHASTPWLEAALGELFSPLIRLSLTRLGFAVICGTTLVAIVVTFFGTLLLKRDFLPAFDEGATQVNLYASPGTSLDTMRGISQIADDKFQTLLKSPSQPDNPLLDITCKMGRAELDEHIMGVHVAEYVMTLNPQASISREEMIQTLTAAVEEIPGVQHEIEQPIAHLISHMLSGVAAQIAIKVFGDDLEELKKVAEEIRQSIETIPGIAEPFVEQQQLVPQLRFELDYQALATYGLTAREAIQLIETAMQGRVVSQFSEGQRTFDILLRMDDQYRQDLGQLHRLHVDLPGGATTVLGTIAKIEQGAGPNTINREKARRRIVVRVNTLGGDMGGIVQQIQDRVSREVELPHGYYVTYGGQFEARQSAQKQILWFSLISMLAVGAVLYSAFPSISAVMQILAAVPTAFIGGVAALVWTDQSLSVAAMVGFVSLAGIATRNGLLLMGTYQELKQQHGLSQEIILQGSLERLAPVLMSSLTTGLGLLPLMIGGTQPGKEMLYPVATVIVGGLVTSTLCEFLIRPGLYWFSQRK
jgi:CzcA family heavy metal efflux pump